MTTLAPPAPATEKKSAAGRKSNAARIESKLAEERAAARLEREQRRAKPLPIDTRVTLGIVLGIAGVVIVTAFTISYATMVAVAEWMQLPWGVLTYAVPGFIELLVILSTLDYVLSRNRGLDANGPLVAMIVLSAVAVLGNAAHTIRGWGSDFGLTHWESFIGVALSALAPLVVVYVAKRVTALVFEHPSDIQ